MEYFEGILEFCRGCEGHVILPNGNEFYLCDCLQAFAQRIQGVWVVIPCSSDRLRNLIRIGKVTMLKAQREHGSN